MVDEKDRSRMLYYLKEMREKFSKHPESLCLRNGIVALEDRLRLPRSIAPCDPIEFIENLQNNETSNPN
jgi:hypothetical protein